MSLNHTTMLALLTTMNCDRDDVLWHCDPILFLWKLKPSLVCNRGLILSHTPDLFCDLSLLP